MYYIILDFFNQQKGQEKSTYENVLQMKTFLIF